jgi:hypothetical protein
MPRLLILHNNHRHSRKLANGVERPSKVPFLSLWEIEGVPVVAAVTLELPMIWRMNSLGSLLHLTATHKKVQNVPYQNFLPLRLRQTGFFLTCTYQRLKM